MSQPGPSSALALRRKDWMANLARLAAAGALKYHRLEVEGEEHLPRQGPALLLPKHHAYRDILVEGVVLYRVTRRLATYVMKVGLWGALELLGGIKVVRPKDVRLLKDRQARRQEIQRARQANQWLHEYLTWLYARGEVVVSHPEGMRYQGRMGPMQREIVEHLLQVEQQSNLRVPLIPIGLEYESFGRPGARVHFRVGQPLYAEQFAGLSALMEAIAERLRVLSGLA
jgi:1-acyl-sn-glycerol-3-phosphate acyltransferase